MIHTLAQIDLVANAGRSPWHRASGLAKLLLVAALIGLAVFAPSLPLLVALYAIAWVLVLSARLPGRLVVAAAFYPVGFALLFVMARWDGTWRTPALILARPLVAGLAAVWLVGTTPYPDLFAPLSRMLPRTVADGLFLTYRALFELVSRAGRLTRALRLRGAGAMPVRRRLTVAGEGLGTLVLYGFERSQRLYATMHLRGHSGRICGCRHWAETTPDDAFVIGAGGVIIGAALALWRMR